MDPLVHGVVGIEPLRVLLVTVEDEGLPDEAGADELEHVPDGRRVAEGQTNLGLEVLRARELVRAPDVLVVVADGLLDEHVLAGLERREGQLLVAVAPAAGDHVDDIDVAAAQDLLRIGNGLGDAELPRGSFREVLVQVADHHHIAERRPREAGKVSAVRPPARADHANAQLLFDHDPRGSSTQRRCRCESATALMTSCTRALWAKLP